MKCEKCNKKHNSAYGSGRFCSSHCAHSRIKTQKIKNKVSKSVISFFKKHPEAKLKLGGHKHSDITKEKIRQYQIKRHQTTNVNLDNFIGQGNKVHRKIELEYKPKIEYYLQTENLQPQKINVNWFDFVNEKYVIELTISTSNGISNAINRFKNIILDKRKKMLIAPQKYFGKKRRKQLLETGTIFVDIVKLN